MMGGEKMEETQTIKIARQIVEILADNDVDIWKAKRILETVSSSFESSPVSKKSFEDYLVPITITDTSNDE